MQVLKVAIAQVGWLRGQVRAAMKPVLCSPSPLVYEYMEGVPLPLPGDPGKNIPWEFPCGRVAKGKFHKEDL